MELPSLSYTDLLAQGDAAQALVASAFSSAPSALGALVVTGLPPFFAPLHARLLQLAYEFGSLPPEVRERSSDPASHYAFGWSHGKERMNGRLDVAKGSFYNNASAGDDEDVRNIWPSEVDIEASFKEMSRFLVELGIQVARLCDGALTAYGGTAGGQGKSLESLIRESRACKARLLHYFPPEGQALSVAASTTGSQDEAAGAVDDSWCGTHIDHGILTALVPSIYHFQPTQRGVDGSVLAPLVIPPPTPATGLYIKTRGGQVVKAVIPAGAVAFQTGETLSLLTRNHLVATPHFVNASTSSLSALPLEVIRNKIELDPNWRNVETGSVSRETMAVFLQPNDDEIVSEVGESFKAFSDRVLLRHYS